MVVVGDSVQDVVCVWLYWAREFYGLAFLRLGCAVFEGGFSAFVQELEGVAEAEAVVVLHELDGVAGFPAVGGHASEKAFAGRDDEIGVVGVVVEWAKANPVGSLLFKFCSPALDEGDDVCGLFYFVNCFVWYSWHGYVLV